MRRINLEALKFWLLTNGELAKEDLAAESRIRFYTIDRILQGKTMPNELQQIALCEATKLTRDELFPNCQVEKKAV